MEPLDIGQPGLPTSVDLRIREQLGQRPLPIPDITPASGDHTRQLGLAPTDEELIVNAIAEEYRDYPDIIAMSADMASWSGERVDELVRLADDIAETAPKGSEALSREDVLHLRGTPEGRILTMMVENLRESEDRDPTVARNANKKIEEFQTAYHLADDIRGQPMSGQYIRRFSTLPATREPADYSLAPAQPTSSVPIPYREGAVGMTPLLGQIAGVESGRQPFRAGLPAVQTTAEPTIAMGTLGMITHRPQPSSPTGQYVPTLSGTISDRTEELRSQIPPSDWEIGNISDNVLEHTVPPNSIYTKADSQTPPSTLAIRPDGAITIMGQTLTPNNITPTSITFRGQTIRFSPNVWKVLTLKDPRSVDLLDLSFKDADNLQNLSDLLGYKEWNRHDPKYRAVVRGTLPRIHETRPMAEQIKSTKRALSKGKMPVSKTRGRKPTVSAEARTEDLEDVLPAQWTARGFDAGIGAGAKKWSPLKLGAGGELGEIEISLPHLLERMELVVKKRNGGKVMMRKKGVPIDLVRLLTRRFNPKVNYTDEAKDIYKKIITMSKVPLGQTHSGKENIMGTGLKVPQNVSTIDKAVANADPDRVLRSFMTDLGTFRNGNRGKVLKNNISEKADFLLEHDIIDKDEHKMIHTIITSKGRKLSVAMEEFLIDLLN